MNVSLKASTSLPFTIPDLIKEVRRLALAEPETTKGCYYFLHDEPHCIMGQALTNLGVSKDYIMVCSNQGKARITATLLKMGATVLIDEEFWLNQMQLEQDKGTPWKYALVRTDNSHPLISQNKDYK